VRIVGRKKDIIIRGGENIPVVEVESALFDHPDVDAAVIVPYPDERLGERACAVAVARAGATLTLDSLQQHLAAAGMSKIFWPERLVLVETLPRTPSGKVAKAELLELAANA
jgi:cyclohexanecarboxylate-CoA ligase